MARVSVLHIITHLGVGGGLDNTLLTVKALSRDRFEVHLAAGELESNEHYSDWTARAKECSDGLFFFPELRRSTDLLRDYSALRRLTNFIRKQNYQIVHTHYAKAGVLGRMAAKSAGVPVIVHTYHTLSWKVAHAFHSSGWRNLVALAKKRLYLAIERYAATLSDALITVDEVNKQEALAYNIAPLDKFVKIYSGIELSRFESSFYDRTALCRKFGLHPEAPIVGTVGRLSIQKSPADFVKAAKIVLQRHPNVQFLMVGDGPLELQTRNAIGSESRIKMAGFHENVPEIMSLIDIFVLSSLWEGLGRALTEAMIMRLPVAATSVGGVPELIIHRKTGLLSPPRNPDKLADNILWLLSHPQQARELGESARAKVVPAFSAEKMVEQIESLYENLLIEKGLSVPSPVYS